MELQVLREAATLAILFQDGVGYLQLTDTSTATTLVFVFPRFPGPSRSSPLEMSTKIGGRFTTYYVPVYYHFLAWRLPHSTALSTVHDHHQSEADMNTHEVILRVTLPLHMDQA